MMVSIDDLLHEMENLPVAQLEALHRFIESRPYKQEGREPTQAELQEVMDEMKRIVAEPHAPDDDYDPVARLMEEMKRRGLD